MPWRAYFQRQDAAAALIPRMGAYQDSGLHYSNGTAGTACCSRGIQLLDRFAQDDRVRIRQPRRNLQVKFTKPRFTEHNDFVAYVDAIGELDGTRCLLEWKTTSSRYPEEPAGLLALDPQLVCYSWVTGIADVAQVVFVRKRLVEIQYFRTAISDEQRENLAIWSRTRSGGSKPPSFCPTVASAFPRTPAPAVPTLGCVWGGRIWQRRALIRRPGAEDLGWLDELTTRIPPMPPKLNRKRALFVLTKIDEILAWEQQGGRTGYPLRGTGTISL